MLIILILDAISHHVKEYHRDDYGVNICYEAYWINYVVIYLIQENAVMTLLGWNVHFNI